MRMYKVLVLVVFSAWIAYVSWQTGYREGLIFSSLWHQEHWTHP